MFKFIVEDLKKDDLRVFASRSDSADNTTTPHLRDHGTHYDLGPLRPPPPRFLRCGLRTHRRRRAERTGILSKVSE